jgi:hypothetical protein
MTDFDFYLPLDPTGSDPGNWVYDEQHVLVENGVKMIIPKYGAFFSRQLVIQHVNADGELVTLEPDYQYVASEMLPEVTRRCGKAVHCAVVILDPEVLGTVTLGYAALGGSDQVHTERLNQALTRAIVGQPVQWDSLNHPLEFRPSDHKQDSRDLYGAEKIVEALNQLRQAIVLSDTALHQQITRQFLPAARERFYETFNTALNNHADALAKINDTALDAIRKSRGMMDAGIRQVEGLNQRYQHLNRTVTSYVQRNQNSMHAIALGEVIRKQYEFNQTVMQAPLYVDGLASWLDFTDAGHVTKTDGRLEVKDRSFHNRVFESTNVEQVFNVALRSKVIRLVGDSLLNQVRGDALNMSAPMTVLAVTARYQHLPERLTLLSGDNQSLVMDIHESEMLCLDGKDGRGMTLRCETPDTLSAHLCAVALSEDAGQHYAVSNSVSVGGSSSSDFEGEVRVEKFVADGVGGQDQCGEIAEIMVYNRQLSRYEIDALMTYVEHKYGLLPNLVVNGNFSEGLTGFETDYQVSVLGQERGEIAVFYKENIGGMSDPFSQFYIFPNYAVITRAMAPRNQFLAVNTHVDSEKAFWKQKVRVQAHVQYALTLTILYNPKNPPRLAVLFNGERHPNIQALTSTAARLDNVTYLFTPDADLVDIALHNIQTLGEINTFAVDNIALRRCF